MANLGWKYLTSLDKTDLARAVTSGTSERGPYHVEIHPADRCNIECFFCSTATLRGTDELALNRVQELIAECGELGVRSLRLAGGGEPLFHRRIADVLRSISQAGIRIENVTTNAVLLRGDVAALLLDCCDEITVSLNTVGEESYASMMQTPAKNYHRVLDNVRCLIDERERQGKRTPEVRLQFLVWRDNFRNIPAMYDFARELRVDRILFNGLAWLPPDKQMSADERREMFDLYEGVIARDEFRRIEQISSFEQSIEAEIAQISTRIAEKRARRSLLEKVRAFLDTTEFSIAEKVAHRRRWRERARIDSAVHGLADECIIGFYSLVVRTNGEIAPCCILQGESLGNVYKSSLEEVWLGDRYTAFREELAALLRAGKKWQHDPAKNVILKPGCSSAHENPCPLKSSYYRRDPEFVRAISTAMA